MPDIRLTKTELAALDLLIAQMEEERALTTGPTGSQLTPVLARVTRILTVIQQQNLTRILATRYTPAIADYPPFSRSATESSLESAAGSLSQGMSLEQLMELRRSVVVEGEPGQAAGSGQSGGETAEGGHKPQSGRK